uniref:Protein YIPF3 n=1 Tax=Strigamia maritima TaxID=126957 RepID=T1JBE2_STRMM
MDFYEQKQSNEDAIIDIEQREDDDKNLHDRSAMLYNMKDHVLQQSREHAQKAFNVYGNIDILRPYFHVEPKELLTRRAFNVKKCFIIIIYLASGININTYKSSKLFLNYRELYGPLMLVLTLIALLLFGMKTAEHVREGTLMGTAFAVCFGYWFGASSFVYLIAYLCNSQISYLQTLSLMGYALSGHCVVLLLGTLIHSHVFFYSIWAIFGGFSALKMVGVMISRTTGYSQRVTISAAVSSIHLLFLLYLHFAYHRTCKYLNILCRKPPA